MRARTAKEQLHLLNRARGEMDAQGRSGKIKKVLHDKASDFLQFAYNRKTRQFFGKTCKGWGRCMYYMCITACT